MDLVTGFINPGTAANSTLQYLLDVTIKATILFASVYLLSMLFRKSSASLQSTVWCAAVVCFALIPLFSALPPIFQAPCVPNLTDLEDLIVKSPLPPDSAPSPSTTAQILMGNRGLNVFESFRLSGLIVLVWFSGVVVSLVMMAIGRLIVLRVCLQASPARESIVRLKDDAAAVLDLRQDVGVLESERTRTAMTCGLLRQVIILPASVDKMSEEMVRSILFHELAHVKRWDYVLEALANLVTAFFWFNPLVWYVVNRLRIERERACDDAVLRAGIKPSVYAKQLLSVAVNMGGIDASLLRGGALSQCCSLKDRLIRVLDTKVKRKGNHILATAVLAAVLLAMAVPLAGFNFWEDRTPPNPSEFDISCLPLTFKALGSDEPYVIHHALRDLDGIAQWCIRESFDFCMRLENPKVRTAVTDMLLEKDKHLTIERMYVTAIHAEEEIIRERALEQIRRLFNDYPAHLPKSALIIPRD